MHLMLAIYVCWRKSISFSSLFCSHTHQGSTWLFNIIRNWPVTQIFYSPALDKFFTRQWSPMVANGRHSHSQFRIRFRGPLAETSCELSSYALYCACAAHLHSRKTHFRTSQCRGPLARAETSFRFSCYAL